MRTAVESERIAVFLNDSFGGTASQADEWTQNYGKGRLLKKGDHLQGTIHLRLIRGKTGNR